VVAAVVCGKKLIGVLRIANDAIEIDDRVEVAGSANPFVDHLPVSLAERAGVVVGGTNVGRNGGAINTEAVSVRTRGDLLVRRDNSLDKRGMIGGRDFAIAGEASQVVYTFEDDEPADACGREDIPVESCQDIWAKAVGEQVVAADALVGDADVAGGG